MCVLNIIILKNAWHSINFMHVQVSESYEFVSHFISFCSRGWGGRIFTKRGRYFPRKSTLGGELVLRIFSPPERISGGRFCPVTPGCYPVISTGPKFATCTTTCYSVAWSTLKYKSQGCNSRTGKH